ncbi:protein of unknown function [Kyrpidia spormannii]|uniref:Uncharacterized protein n=2 Tax=Kyrpidia spormannii TaxID=2055160 RepID=A0ACA8Z629_9BACL|nr:protein of unknown function [Kyrpidia spormannii]CAB3391176.1 protein of unknown function [Kyrpidia spormannii]
MLDIRNKHYDNNAILGQIIPTVVLDVKFYFLKCYIIFPISGIALVRRKSRRG